MRDEYMSFPTTDNRRPTTVCGRRSSVVSRHIPETMQRERRTLGLDLGQRRIGVALSDVYGTLASPLTTVQGMPRQYAIEQIQRLIREYEVMEIVIGLPLTLRGEIGPQAKEVQAFAEALGKAVALPIHFFDERLTTAAAEQMLRELGVKPEKRKQQIDQVAATIILQDYLDHTRNHEQLDKE
jgi:putative holliday junction resolvase